MTNPMSRVWVFTINNPIPGDLIILEHIACQELVVGQEIGASGTPHLQGYIKFDKPARRTKVSHILPRAHVEICRDTSPGHKAAKDYCRKDGNILHNREDALTRGTRSDLDRLVVAMTQGGLTQAKADCPKGLIQFPGGCKLFCSIGRLSVNRPDLRVVVYTGPTGTGKSRAAFTQTPLFAPTLPVRVGDMCWFDGYAGEGVLVLDEFAGSMAFRFLLRLLDIYPLNVPAKGLMLAAHWNKVIITSNFHPREWYPSENYDVLARRIHGIYEHPPWDLGVLPY